MLQRIDVQAVRTGTLVVFCAATRVRGKRRVPQMRLVQRVIVETTIEREAVHGDGTRARTHVGLAATHVGVAVVASDLFEQNEVPPGVRGIDVLVLEQTSSSWFNDNVPDVWGKRHLAEAQLRPLAAVVEKATARGASVYAIAPPRECGYVSYTGELEGGVAWRDALRAYVFARLGQRYENPLMLLAMKLGLDRTVLRSVPRGLRTRVTDSAMTCSELAWEFGCSALMPLSAEERAAAAAEEAQGVLPSDVVTLSTSPWASGELRCLATSRWRVSDDRARGMNPSAQPAPLDWDMGRDPALPEARRESTTSSTVVEVEVSDTEAPPNAALPLPPSLATPSILGGQRSAASAARADEGATDYVALPAVTGASSVPPLPPREDARSAARVDDYSNVLSVLEQLANV